MDSSENASVACGTEMLEMFKKYILGIQRNKVHIVKNLFILFINILLLFRKLYFIIEKIFFFLHFCETTPALIKSFQTEKSFIWDSKSSQLVIS